MTKPWNITLFVLLTAIKLVGEADSSSGSLSWTVDVALETVELAANGLVQEGGSREKFVRKILKEDGRNPRLAAEGSNQIIL